MICQIQDVGSVVCAHLHASDELPGVEGRLLTYYGDCINVTLTVEAILTGLRRLIIPTKT